MSYKNKNAKIVTNTKQISTGKTTTNLLPFHSEITMDVQICDIKCLNPDRKSKLVYDTKN